MNEEWLSAYLDGELSTVEAREVEAALAADPDVAATCADLARIRSTVRDAVVDIPVGALERIVASVESDGAQGSQAPVGAAVVALRRRRVPTFAAAAAAMAIIAGVVGGLGGSTTVPALGDLIARHEVAAAVLDGAPMPAEMDDMEPISMDEATVASLPMPADYSMEQAFAEGDTIHLVYRSGLGDPVSVFRQDGDVDMDALGDGSMTHGEEADMWSAAIDGSYVAVVDGDGYLWIVVSPAPPDDMMDDMMDDLPTRSPGVKERLRDAADAVVDAFRIWD
ncbi:MAG: zf-HC2 domain-containing protein [Acidimicrobiales bacterium]